MKRPRVRIGTLMLLIIIAALAVALAVEKRRSAAMLVESEVRRAEALHREQAVTQFLRNSLPTATPKPSEGAAEKTPP